MDTTLERRVRAIAADVAARCAPDVDRRARFPDETFAALRSERALSAGVPRELGGGGYGLRELGAMAAGLARGCGSSAMVLAMHHIQVACLVRHGRSSPVLRDYLAELADHQYLLASMTSEVGTGGDMRSSRCAVDRADGRFVLRKAATTGSYCAHADGVLVTARRAPDAAPSDQVLVLVRASESTMVPTTAWDTLGMRGTCSPGFQLEAAGAAEQILPDAFAAIAARTMVPYSHALWASVWYGIAADAVARATAYVRADARTAPATPRAGSRLAEAWARLQTMRQHWASLADDVDAVGSDPARLAELESMGWAVRLNSLKVAASSAAPGVVDDALRVLGIMGYKNDSPFSVGRHYRDVLSAPLMISNDRISATTSAMLLALKDDMG